MLALPVALTATNILFGGSGGTAPCRNIMIRTATRLAASLQEKQMKRRKKTPAWFRIAVWSGMAVFALILAWLIGAGAENAFEAVAE